MFSTVTAAMDLQRLSLGAITSNRDSFYDDAKIRESVVLSEDLNDDQRTSVYKMLLERRGVLSTGGR